MQNGLYVAASGMIMQQTRLDTISNNLANMNTNAFKKDVPVFSLYKPSEERHPQKLIRETLYNKTINSAVILDDITVNHTRGAFKSTGNRLDFAMANEKAFFAVDTPWGVRYTRDGAFTMNSDGELVTQDGYPVLSRAAQGTANINIPQNATIEVDKNGVIYANGVPGEALLTVEFEDTARLQKVGRNEYTAVDIEPIDAAAPDVRQGFLEGANVEPITEMVRMVEASRGYEMYSKAIQTHDDMNQKAATRIMGQA